MNNTIIGLSIGFLIGIITGIVLVSHAHLWYKRGIQVWSIRRKLYKVKVFIKSIAGIIFSGLYKVAHKKDIASSKEAVGEFLESFNTIQELNFLDYICKTVIKSSSDEKEIKLSSREDLREILRVGKNIIPQLIKKFEEQGIIRVTSNYSDSLKRNKGGNNQAMFACIEKDKAVELLKLSEIAKKTNLITSKKIPCQKYPKALKDKKVRGKKF